MNLKGFDFFRKVHSDIESSTFTGGIFSMLSLIFGIYLFLQEIQYFQNKEVHRNMLIDNNFHENQIRININIELQKFPCHILSLCQEDDLGHHSVGIDENLIKFRLDKNGKKIKGKWTKNYQNLAKAIKNEEGCNLEGFIDVAKVPGDFHLSYHAHRDLLNELDHNQLEKLDLTHKINHLSFTVLGQDEKNLTILQTFLDHDVAVNFSPYDGYQYDAQKKNYEYFIKVVSNIFENDESSFKSYQFSMTQQTSNIVEGGQMSLYFKYSLSPITVKYTIKQHSFAHFIIQILAIVGGIFSAIGIVNSITQESISIFKKIM